jgi:hypothetical protein
MKSSLLVILFVIPAALSARRAPDRLTEPDQIQAFYRLTSQVRCYCGCAGLSGDCGHVEESCFGVQMRRFIEHRIAEGMAEEQILKGIVEGFGPAILRDQQVRELERLGRQDLVNGFRDGFGKHIIYREPSTFPFGAIAVVGLGTVFLWFILRPRRVKASPSGDNAARILEQTRQLDR